MSPERAQQLVRAMIDYCGDDVVQVILAACAEAELEAYTRAAKACDALMTDATWHEYASAHNKSCEDCAGAIEKLRDQ